MKNYLTKILFFLFCIAVAYLFAAKADVQSFDEIELKELNLLGEKLIQSIKEDNVEIFLSCFYSSEDMEYLNRRKPGWLPVNFNEYQELIKKRLNRLLSDFKNLGIDKQQITYQSIRTSPVHYATDEKITICKIYVYFFYKKKLYAIEDERCTNINTGWKFSESINLKGVFKYIKKQKGKFTYKKRTWVELLMIKSDVSGPIHVIDKQGKLYFEQCLVLTMKDSLPFTGTSVKTTENSVYVEEYWRDGKWSGFEQRNKKYKIESKITESPKSIYGKWELQMKWQLGMDEIMEKNMSDNYGRCDYFGLEILQNNRLKSYQFSNIRDSILWEVWENALCVYYPPYNCFIFSTDEPFYMLQKRDGEIIDYGGSGVFYIHPSMMEGHDDVPYNCIFANPDELIISLCWGKENGGYRMVWVFKRVYEFRFNKKFESFESEYKQLKENAPELMKAISIKIDSLNNAIKLLNETPSMEDKQHILKKLNDARDKEKNKRKAYGILLRTQ